MGAAAVVGGCASNGSLPEKVNNLDQRVSTLERKNIPVQNLLYKFESSAKKRVFGSKDKEGKKWEKKYIDGLLGKDGLFGEDARIYSITSQVTIPDQPCSAHITYNLLIRDKEGNDVAMIVLQDNDLDGTSDKNQVIRYQKYGFRVCEQTEDMDPEQAAKLLELLEQDPALSPTHAKAFRVDGGKREPYNTPILKIVKARYSNSNCPTPCAEAEQVKEPK